MAVILDLPISVFIDYLMHALEKEREQAAWDLWSRLYPHMIEKTIKYKDFSEFKRELFKPKIKPTNKTAEEIEAEMMRVIDSYEQKLPAPETDLAK